MSEGLFSLIAGVAAAAEDQRVYGAVSAQVVDNADSTGRGRVQIHIPWLPDQDPWARVAVPSAGKDRGIYFIPQIGDEVLVLFANGDVREPYVIGSLWNDQDDPPATGLQEPEQRRIVRTPRGPTIELDDQPEKITITSSSGHKLTMAPEGVRIDVKDGVTLEMTRQGEVKLEATQSITLRSATITIDADATAEVKSNASATLKAAATCTISGALVQIN